MSRFRFRVRDTKDKEYLDPNYFEGFCLFPDGSPHVGMTVYNGICDEYQAIPPKQLIIEQCTGLRDKHGTLIYGGDFVKIAFRDQTLHFCHAEKRSFLKVLMCWIIGLLKSSVTFMKWRKKMIYVEQIDARKHTVIHRNGERNALGQFIKGCKFSKAVKEAISKGRKGIKFKDEHCENIAKAKIGDKNPAYGKVGFDSYRGRQVICLDTGEVFGSILEASRKMKTHSTVIRRNADGLIKKPRKYRWAWVNESEVKDE